MKRIFLNSLEMILVGTAAFADIRVNTDTSDRWQGYPEIAVNHNGFIVGWQEEFDDSSFIFIQCYDTAETPLGTNKRLSSDSYQTLPALCSLSDSMWLGVWIEDYNGRWNILAQRFNLNGDSLSSAFQINDILSYCYCPSAAADNNGNFTVVWMDFRNGWRIYGRRFLANGIPLGSDILLSDLFGMDPKIAMRSDGSFAIVWQSDDGNIYWRRFDANTTPSGPSDRVNARALNLDYAQPAIAVNDSNNYCIAWTRATITGVAIMAQFFDSTGTAVGALNTVVNEDTLIWGGHCTVTAVSDNKFVIGWTDERDWVDNYCQRYQNCNQPDGGNLRISSSSGIGERYRESVRLASCGKEIFATWQDLRDTSQTWDIYARKVSYEALGVEELQSSSESGLKPAIYSFSWPNPGRNFKIGYRLANLKKPVKVSVSIYNICGQKLRVLNDGIKGQGEYILHWDGRNQRGVSVSPGVYFYLIFGGGLKSAGKLVVVK
ncbi:MAG: T9SS type A sorting domain-containing protein [Candidatus Edwardsbacteria bacterium]